jgi:rhodanese-related sulfurtransferase
MKNWLSLFCGTIASTLIFSCTPATGQIERPTITNSSLDQKLAGMLKFSVPLISVEALHIKIEKEKIYIFDTREYKEFQISHIPNARHLGYSDFNLTRVKDVPKDATVVVYCSVGYRSEKIGERLIAKGYTHVLNLYGSIFEWAEQGLPLEDSNSQATNKLHTYNREWGKWIKGKEIHKIW